MGKGNIMGVKDNPLCKKCFYYEHVHNSIWGCFYILYAKQRRGCSPDACIRYLPKTCKNKRAISLHGMVLGERGAL